MKQLEYISANRIDWKNVPEPEINGAGQAILKPVSIARCDLDLPIIHGKTLFRGVFPLGHEWIGEIVEVSPDLQEKFKKGSRYGVTFQ
ncbi:MAG: alcohol dehydrogenase catalytic domain-containing protein, partial [Leptospira sp.]|nr:alcohol dehydrogenase catalytic domain-containing protein [Leptospira sp.]